MAMFGIKGIKGIKGARGKKARGRLPCNRSCYLYYKKHILQEDSWRSGTQWSGSPSLWIFFFSLSSTICFAGLEMGCVDMRDNIMICSSKHKLLLWILCGRRRLCCSTNRTQVRKRSNVIRKVYGRKQEQMIKRWAIEY